MQQIALIPQGSFAPQEAPVLVRGVVQIVVDALLVAAASLIVGGLLVHYQFGHASSPRPAAAQSGPATVAMMQLVRDEHAAVMDYVKEQTAAEKARNAAEDKADAQAVADAKLATAATTSRPAPVAVAAAAPVVPRARARGPVIAPTPLPPQAPLVIAQAQQTDSAAPAEDGIPAESDSLLAKTVHATLHAVSAIGGIPNWIAAMGGRIGGDSDATGEARLVSSSS